MNIFDLQLLTNDQLIDLAKSRMTLSEHRYTRDADDDDSIYVPLRSWHRNDVVVSLCGEPRSLVVDLYNLPDEIPQALITNLGPVEPLRTYHRVRYPRSNNPTPGDLERTIYIIHLLVSFALNPNPP